jgi:hypothetical protein
MHPIDISSDVDIDDIAVLQHVAVWNAVTAHLDGEIYYIFSLLKHQTLSFFHTSSAIHNCIVADDFNSIKRTLTSFTDVQTLLGNPALKKKG